ncbi:hypothetical protein Q9L58_008058 [Maublancomyces gigas]|uniref:Uncharacterized protein n=1 Tax=Discina gigas TaxID=1032678 RepID=A0ABR3GB07_9PEZI
MKLSTSILLSILSFAVSALAQLSGSDECLTDECQALLLLCSDCSYPLQTTADITPTQSQCICDSTGFADILGICLFCMQSHNMANFSKPTWDRLCPSINAPSDPENSNTESSDPSGTLSVDPAVKIAGAESTAYGRRMGFVVGGILVAVGVGVML